MLKPLDSVGKLVPFLSKEPKDKMGDLSPAHCLCIGEVGVAAGVSHLQTKVSAARSRQNIYSWAIFLDCLSNKYFDFPCPQLLNPSAIIFASLSSQLSPPTILPPNPCGAAFFGSV
eukprot:633656-Hanusia_phi.AAC.1